MIHGHSLTLAIASPKIKTSAENRSSSSRSGGTFTALWLKIKLHKHLVHDSAIYNREKCGKIWQKHFCCIHVYNHTVNPPSLPPTHTEHQHPHTPTWAELPSNTHTNTDLMSLTNQLLIYKCHKKSFRKYQTETRVWSATLVEVHWPFHFGGDIFNCNKSALRKINNCIELISI